MLTESRAAVKPDTPPLQPRAIGLPDHARLVAALREDRQVIGDSLIPGRVRLTVREMEGPTITRVGLKF